jgi:hypothetical protein
MARYAVQVRMTGEVSKPIDLGVFASLASAKKACKTYIESTKFSYHRECLIIPEAPAKKATKTRAKRSGAAQMAKLIDRKLFPGFRR